MSSLYQYQVNLATLATDLQSAFTAHRNESNPHAPALINITGDGRIARDFADLLVQEIEASQLQLLALVRDDLLIQFLVSSINLRTPKVEVKAFKTVQDATAWLAKCTELEGV